jgi:signal transduction histidine kinase
MIDAATAGEVVHRREVAPPAAAELIARIAWLIRMRWLAVVGVAVFLEGARRIFPVELRVGPLYAVLGALAVYNAILALVHRRLRGEAPRWAQRHIRGVTRILIPRSLWDLDGEPEALRAAVFAALQITIDLVALAMLLHFGGGLENPFIIFFVFHVIIASILLSRRATYLQTSFGFALIAGVGLGECFGLLPHVPLNGAWRHDAYLDPTLVAAELLVLGITLYLAAYMGSTIAARLRFRERETVVLSKAVAEQAEALEAAYRRLQEVESAKSQYMRKVSHELRGPLGTVQTALKVVMQRSAASVDPESRDLLERAERRVGELAEVTSDLLALSRAREGRLQAERTEVDLRAVVREQLDEALADAERAGVTVSGRDAGGPALVLGDRRDLGQLCRNLLSNAIRYTGRGGRVSVELERAGDRIRLRVEDTGIGIPEGELAQVFGEFYRAANARDRVPAGTGLGLAIVRSVAEQHGGTVDVESELGRGTRFTVELPAAAPAAGEDAPGR